MEKLQAFIPEHIFQQLIKHDFDSLNQIMVLNKNELQDQLKLKSNEAELLLKETAAILMESKIFKASEMEEWSKLSTGCKNIDEVIGGGIPAAGISEIFGFSGVGKTQLCLQLSLMVQFPRTIGGFGKGAIYINSEEIFPSKRLHSLAKFLPKALDYSNEINFEDNVFVEHIADYEQCRRCLYGRLPQLLEKIPIGLIILDSIAGIFRSETSGADFVNRSEEIFTISSKLKEFSKKYNLVVVCVNQVTDNITKNKAEPCLGYAWANLVTSRFEIIRSSYPNTTRTFRIINAPHLKPSECNFIIQEDGLNGI